MRAAAEAFSRFASLFRAGILMPPIYTDYFFIFLFSLPLPPHYLLLPCPSPLAASLRVSDADIAYEAAF
jgi:hypothetical protein